MQTTIDTTFKVRNSIMKVTDEQKLVLRATASEGLEADNARQALAQTMSQAWKAGVLEPDTRGNIFTMIPLPAGVDAKFPFDFYVPGEEGNYLAFVMPQTGKIPDRIIEGDEARVPTYKIANSISWSLDYARDGRWDIVGRAIEVFTNGFVRKLNDDAWHTLLQSAVSSITTVQDSAAGAGVFTKKLLLNMMTAIKRQTGGRNARLTDLYVSPEVLSDIRNFDNTVLDDLTLRSLLVAAEGTIPSLYGVKLHELQELGVNQEYNDYIVNTLGRALTGSDDEYVVGFDLLHRDSFVMPIREDMEMFDDPTLHRSGKMGVYGWMIQGFAALDNRRVILGSL